MVVASPAYLAAHGTPQTPDALADHRWLGYGASTMLQRWPYARRDGTPGSVTLKMALCSNNGHVLRQAVLAGQGIAELPTFLVGCDIAAGALTVVLSDYARGDLGVYALYAPNRFLAAKTRAFIDFLAARFSADPEWERFDLRRSGSAT